MAIASRERSPYYPPRARWYSPLLEARDRFGYELALDRLNPALGANVRLLPLLAGFFIPGVAFYFRAPGIIGKAALAWTALLLLAFVALLGNSWDNLVFAMLLSAHVSGFVFYCNPLVSSALRDRLLFTLLMVVLIRALVYYPAQTFVDNYLVSPMQWRDRVVIINREYSADAIRPGDWVAYTAQEYFVPGEGGVYAAGGLDLAPVLAVPGDVVEFSTDSYSVNGVPRPKLLHMPSSGSIVVPQKEWLVWPNLAIDVHHIEPAVLSATLLQLSRVTEAQLIGKPFQRWFWWKQILP